MFRRSYPVPCVALVLLALAACGATPASHGGPVRDYVSLVDALRKQGATVTPQGDVPTSEFFAAPGYTLSVNGQSVEVREFADDAALAVGAGRISADGGTITGTAANPRSQTATSVDWVEPPHFYKAGRILVIYLGRDQATLTLLRNVLGAPFAERPA